jgi:CHAT domain-containing protein
MTRGTLVTLLAIQYEHLRSGRPADNLDRAIEIYETALRIHTREKFPKQWAVIQTNLGSAYRKRASENDIRNALTAYRSALTVRTPEAFPREHLDTALLLAALLFDTRDWTGARAVLATARDAFSLLFSGELDQTKGQDLILRAGSLFTDAAYAAANEADPYAALTLLEEGKTHLMKATLHRQSLDYTPKEWANLNAIAFEVRALEKSSGLGGKGFVDLAAIERISTLRRDQLAIIKAAEQRTDPRGTVVPMLQTLVPRGGAIVALIPSKFGSKLLVASSPNAQLQLSVIDFPELSNDRLDKLMRGDGSKVGASGGWLGAFNLQYLPNEERDARIGEWTSAIENIGPELWHLFAARLHAVLKEDKITPGARIVWLPARSLGLVPLGLARDSLSNRRFGDMYEIATAPSLEALARAAEQVARQQPPSLIAAINPTGEIPELTLPFTEIEGAIVAAHFPGNRQTTLDKTNATPNAVLGALYGKSYWHFSSHGAFDWIDARRAGLIMRDNVPLTIGALQDAQGLGHPRLVVLSACETGLYDASRNPDEFVGLPATFMQLGAAGVLGTLWQVDDLATALLMAKFYDLHIDNGLPPPTSIQRAQSWLRNATKADLIGYARSAAVRAKLSTSNAQELETTLSTTRRRTSRFSTIWNKLQAGDTKSYAKRASDNSIRDHPFAHPYYWGGFTYMGL